MMKVRQGLRRRRGSRLLIALIGLATYAALLAMLFAVFTPERYDLVAGQVSPITVTASKDVVDSVTTQQMIDEAVAAVAGRVRGRAVARVVAVGAPRVVLRLLPRTRRVRAGRVAAPRTAIAR